jgi:hypothetical protein
MKKFIRNAVLFFAVFLSLMQAIISSDDQANVVIAKNGKVQDANIYKSYTSFLQKTETVKAQTEAKELYFNQDEYENMFNKDNSVDEDEDELSDEEVIDKLF